MGYFLRYSLKGNERQYYNQLVLEKQTWRQMMKGLEQQYASENNNEEIRSRLTHVRINDCRGQDTTEDHEALDRFVEKLNSLTPMAKNKDQDEGAKVSYLKNAAMGTD